MFDIFSADYLCLHSHSALKGINQKNKMTLLLLHSPERGRDWHGKWHGKWRGIGVKRGINVLGYFDLEIKYLCFVAIWDQLEWIKHVNLTPFNTPLMFRRALKLFLPTYLFSFMWERAPRLVGSNKTNSTSIICPIFSGRIMFFKTAWCF